MYPSYSCEMKIEIPRVRRRCKEWVKEIEDAIRLSRNATDIAYMKFQLRRAVIWRDSILDTLSNIPAEFAPQEELVSNVQLDGGSSHGVDIANDAPILAEGAGGVSIVDNQTVFLFGDELDDVDEQDVFDEIESYGNDDEARHEDRQNDVEVSPDLMDETA